jgi:hypothetical protein
MTVFENLLINSSGVVLDISNPALPAEAVRFDTGINTVDSLTFGGLANCKSYCR